MYLSLCFSLSLCQSVSFVISPCQSCISCFLCSPVVFCSSCSLRVPSASLVYTLFSFYMFCTPLILSFAPDQLLLFCCLCCQQPFLTFWFVYLDLRLVIKAGLLFFHLPASECLGYSTNFNTCAVF